MVALVTDEVKLGSPEQALVNLKSRFWDTRTKFIMGVSGSLFLIGDGLWRIISIQKGITGYPPPDITTPLIGGSFEGFIGAFGLGVSLEYFFRRIRRLGTIQEELLRSKSPSNM